MHVDQIGLRLQMLFFVIFHFRLAPQVRTSDVLCRLRAQLKGAGWVGRRRLHFLVSGLGMVVSRVLMRRPAVQTPVWRLKMQLVWHLPPVLAV